MATWSVTGLDTVPALSTTANVNVQGTLNTNRLITNTFTVSSLNAIQVQEQGNPLIPVGIICMWTGTEPPPGWALCNGQIVNRIRDGTPLFTPDLRGRFILGYNPDLTLSESGALTPNTLGKVGGAETHTLTPAQIPSHTHSYSNWRVKGQYDSYKRSMKEGGGDAYTILDVNSNNPSEPTWSTSSVGEGKPHNNMPPYYVLAYIIKI